MSLKEFNERSDKISNFELKEKILNSIKYTGVNDNIKKKHVIVATINGIKIGEYPTFEKAEKLAPIKLKNILLGYTSTEKYNQIQNNIKFL